MSELEGVAPEPPRAASPPHFSILVTVVCSLVVAFYVGLPLGPLIRDASPLDQLERPEDSLQRLVTRELDLDETLHRELSWEWRLYRALSGTEDPVQEARAWYDELADSADSEAVELRRAILLAESGETSRLERIVRRWRERDESSRRMADWVSAAYLGHPPAPDAGRRLILEVRDSLEPNWFADALSRRIAARIGDASARLQAESTILARGRVLQQRQRLLWALVTVLLAGGAVALGLMLARRTSPRMADATLPPDWSTADGYALFVRALGAPQAIILVVFYFLRREAPTDGILMMAADLPVFWWVASYLRTRDRSIRGAFGLVPRRHGWSRIVGVTLILIALGIVGDFVIDTIGALLGFKAHWADGFSEDMLWYPRWAFVVNAFNATVWAPVVEELTFRGLLYATLRTRLGMWPAALVSAAIFALPHGYAAAGSLSVLLSGVLWAVAYERTRSLLPGLIAHSTNNVMSTLWVVALLRL
ncbi:MAG TPA: type II CAAX endopeptidase family protein [Candidatus Methylomirabilis sp.]|nr:type II CAAX endopeptidase family protein [Candidatus Methylomirabilis sp.]